MMRRTRVRGSRGPDTSTERSRVKLEELISTTFWASHGEGYVYDMRESNIIGCIWRLLNKGLVLILCLHTLLCTLSLVPYTRGACEVGQCVCSFSFESLGWQRTLNVHLNFYYRGRAGKHMIFT